MTRFIKFDDRSIEKFSEIFSLEWYVIKIANEEIKFYLNNVPFVEFSKLRLPVT